MTFFRLILVAATTVVLSHGPSCAAGAPSALLNKTIRLDWTQSSTQRAEDGRTVNPTIRHQRTIYISSQGRIFARAVRSINNRNFSGSKTGQLAPGETKGYAGGATAVRFEGNEIVGTQAHISGAAQFRVSFDPSFASCKVRLIYGRSGSNLRMRGLDGRLYEVISTSASADNCSISDGNAFAD